MHEQSETIQDPTTGRWINVYGRRTPQAGQQLPGTATYNTLQEAIEAAKQRSREEGERLRRPSGPRSEASDTYVELMRGSLHGSGPFTPAEIARGYRRIKA